MEDIVSDIRASKELLENALHNSGVAISQQDLGLYYTHFTNTHPGMAGESLIGKTDADWLPTREVKKANRY